jgi:isochorismate synthase
MTEHETAVDKTPRERDFVQSFSPVLRAAAHRARDLGRPILASLTARLPGDFSSNRDIYRDTRLGDSRVPFGGLDQYFIWEQPEREFSITAAGEAVRVAASGGTRFSSVRCQLERIAADAIFAGSEPALPFCLAGFSFDTTRQRSKEWEAFPDAVATIPGILFTQRSGSHYLTLNSHVKTDTGIDEVLGGLDSLMAAMLASQPAIGAHGCAPLQKESDRDDLPDWCKSVLSLTDAIAAGEAEKVVLARRVELRADAAFDVAQALERLRGRYPNCTIFAVRNRDDCFLGATPEMLVRLEDGLVRADCLAGSARRGTTEEEDDAIGRELLADEKERREHAMVVRGLVDSLHAVCVAIDAPSTPSLRRMANVQHLHTPIEATVPGERHVLELVERLHPTPAVGGLPRSRALCLIRENERFDRGWYAGPIGWLDAKGGGEFAVGLRSALVRGDRAFLYAGCGIVSGSDPDREYEESRIKLEAMRWALSGKA